jgi:hypothetical protein
MSLNEYTLKVTEEQLRFIARAFEKKAQSHFNGNPKNFSLHIEKARPFWAAFSKIEHSLSTAYHPDAHEIDLTKV